MPFNEINDPKGICKDVTALGRWGNGDVEVELKSIDEIPYIMGLVRQSYERPDGRRGRNLNIKHNHTKSGYVEETVF